MTQENNDLDLVNIGSSGLEYLSTDNGGGLYKMIKEMLSAGENTNELLTRGRLTSPEVKATVDILNRAARLKDRVKEEKAKKMGIDFQSMSQLERIASYNIALSISENGLGRSEIVSALTGTVQRVRNSILPSDRKERRF
tara:strand:+ start:316 stop:735 length:420 start_codon:yes stop_codon:yes gene_type:complete